MHGKTRFFFFFNQSINQSINQITEWIVTQMGRWILDTFFGVYDDKNHVWIF